MNGTVLFIIGVCLLVTAFVLLPAFLLLYAIVAGAVTS